MSLLVNPALVTEVQLSEFGFSTKGPGPAAGRTMNPGDWANEAIDKQTCKREKSSKFHSFIRHMGDFGIKITTI
jgi:hypothetical protein